MSKTLLLRLATPMQSWGDSSKFNNRTTRREPTKSGIIGLVAAALGRTRDDNVDDLVSLKFGVRIDQVGNIVRDFHTVKQWYKDKDPDSYVTERYYLEDAVFVVGLQGDESLLEKIKVALFSPVFPIGLGRRACVPELPLVLGIRDCGLRDALKNERWHARKWYQRRYEGTHKNNGENLMLEVMVDADSEVLSDDGQFLVRDIPLSFSQDHRKYGFRFVKDKIDFVNVEEIEKSVDHNEETSHDAFEFAGKS